VTWDELKRRGYELAISKQGWSLWVHLGDVRELVASGSKRPATPRITIEKRALPYAVADFVKRRIDDPPARPKLDVDDVRRHAQHMLANWMAKTIDEKMYEAIKTYKR
jgi:hypothetical protein